MSIIMMKGLPASGKTTYAKQRVNSSNTTKRINKDDLRQMIDNGKWSKSSENLILKSRNALCDTLLSDGYDVIVDDTNLHPKHELVLSYIAKKHGTDLKIVYLTNVPVEMCINNDLKRDSPVVKL